ncbi:hypothetical protein AAG906_039330 [Vitis piasezkii]
MAKLLETKLHEETKLLSLIVLCLSHSKYARNEQWRRGKQRSQESDSLNRVQFGAEMRKIWHSEDNCINHSCNSLARKYSRKGKLPSSINSLGNPNAYLSMRDRMHPPRMSAPSCIVPPLEQLIIRPHIVPLLPNFHGMESENPYAHIKEFEENQWVEETNLKLFAKENEKFYECWERYMEAINACPHHGFDTWLLVSRGWDEPNSREKGRMPAPVNPKGGMYMLSEDMDMKAKVATMARRLEELELKKGHEVQAISETQAHVMPCTICQSCDHVVDECPTIPAVREMLGDQANVVGQFRPNNNAPYGNTYNSSWRNHPNFSWKPRPPPYQPQAQTQAPQQTSSWSKPL